VRHAAAVGLAAVAFGGCGGGDGQERSGDLNWVGTPKVLRPPGLPHDRVLSGTLRNDSFKRLTLVGRDVRLETRDGKRVPSAVVFGRTFVRGVFPLNRAEGSPEVEQFRVRLRVRLDPRQKTPVTVSWRQTPGRPVRLRYGTGFLPLPRG
jgi:hypothetical protein